MTLRTLFSIGLLAGFATPIYGSPYLRLGPRQYSASSSTGTITTATDSPCVTTTAISTETFISTVTITNSLATPSISSRTMWNSTSSSVASAVPPTNPTSAPPSQSNPTSPSCSGTAEPPAPTQEGIVQGCTQWYVAKPGDFCYSVAQQFGISVDTFMSWNPAVVPPDCPRMLAGDAYCVAACGGPSASLSASPSVSGSATSTSATYSSASSYVPNPSQGPLDHYKTYQGNGSPEDGWPSIEDWASFDYLWEHNVPNMKISCAQWGVPDNSDQELDDMKSSIRDVAKATDMDERFILAIIVQESTGCVRVVTTAYSHANPGLMQSFMGSGTCNNNTANIELPGVHKKYPILTPCPKEQIHQMILDGTDGTQWGPGLKDDFNDQLNSNGGSGDAKGYYRAARIYNGGHLLSDGTLEGPCCTASYVSDIANRLCGWVLSPKTWTGGYK